ncbi:MAG: DUF4349 domain-containing protein [Candidatus Magasanikbacteria bacterium]|nr:DUF4349 domain-containing protein [Candidatus Magasanikbacteria bacterium]
MSKSKLHGLIVIIFAIVGIAYIGNRFVASRLLVTTGSSGMMQVSDSFGLAAAEYYAPKAADSAIGNMMGRASTGMMPPVPAPGGSVAVDVAPEDRLIIKSANISLLVKDVPNSIQSVQKYVTENKGFVVSSNVAKDGLGFTGYVTFRIPVETFNASLAAVAGLGEVKSQQVDGQDVTAEFVDVEAQLKNLKATEAQFLQIMSRAQKIEDVLAVQRELTNVRSQIESFEGRKKYLSQSAAMSTVTVNLATNPNDLPVIEKEPSWKPLAVFKDAVRSLLELGKGIVNFLIIFVVFIPVWALIGLVVWTVYRRFNRS